MTASEPTTRAISNEAVEALVAHRYLIGSDRGVYPRWEECVCGERFTTTKDTPAWELLAAHQASKLLHLTQPSDEAAVNRLPVVAHAVVEDVPTLLNHVAVLEQTIEGLRGEVARANTVADSTGLVGELAVLVQQTNNLLEAERDEARAALDAQTAAIMNACPQCHSSGLVQNYPGEGPDDCPTCTWVRAAVNNPGDALAKHDQQVRERMAMAIETQLGVPQVTTAYTHGKQDAVEAAARILRGAGGGL